MTTKLRRARAKKGVKQALRHIPAEEVKAILEPEANIAQLKTEQSKERKPGQEIEGAKIAWTRRDIEKTFPIVELLSEETVAITWNGVRYQLLMGATHYVPSVIRDAYLNHRRETRLAGKDLTSNTGFISVVELGAGALPPE